jgi:hypothetical protein
MNMIEIKRFRNGQMNHVASIILIVMGAIVMLLFMQQFIERATPEETINTCRFSVITQVASEIKPGITGAKSPFDINCHKRYVKFYNSKVELGLNPENMKPIDITVEGEKVKKFRSLTEHTVDQVIAEELRICKYQFGDGKVSVFANDDNFWGGKNVCFVCSEISFESDKIDEETFETLVEYTNKTTFNDDGTTYMDYLTEESFTLNTLWVQPTFDFSDDTQSRFMINSFWRGAWFKNDEAKQYADLSIDTSKRYYVFFEKYNPRAGIILNKEKYNVKDSPPEEWYDIEQYWVAIVPVDDIANYCDIQAN